MFGDGPDDRGAEVAVPHETDEELPVQQIIERLDYLDVRVEVDTSVTFQDVEANVVRNQGPALPIVCVGDLRRLRDVVVRFVPRTDLVAWLEPVNGLQATFDLGGCLAVAEPAQVNDPRNSHGVALRACYKFSMFSGASVPLTRSLSANTFSSSRPLPS